MIRELERLTQTSRVRLLNSSLYQEYAAEREEVLRHKWIESEKQGADIGYETAVLNWKLRHRSNWVKTRRRLSVPSD